MNLTPGVVPFSCHAWYPSRYGNSTHQVLSHCSVAINTGLATTPRLPVNMSLIVLQSCSCCYFVHIHGFIECVHERSYFGCIWVMSGSAKPRPSCNFSIPFLIETTRHGSVIMCLQYKVLSEVKTISPHMDRRYFGLVHVKWHEFLP